MTKGDSRFYRRLGTTVAQREVGTFRDEERRSVLRPSLPRVVQGRKTRMIAQIDQGSCVQQGSNHRRIVL